MAVPTFIDARLYYRCAIQRFEEAQILHKAGKHTGAVYLSGYSVECILKALALSMTPMKKRSELIGSFRKQGQGHDFEWLRTQYYQNGGSSFPRNVNACFTLVLDWSTDLRYEPKSIKPSEADEFMKAADTILKWADGRL